MSHRTEDELHSWTNWQEERRARNTLLVARVGMDSLIIKARSKLWPGDRCSLGGRREEGVEVVTWNSHATEGAEVTCRAAMSGRGPGLVAARK